MSSEDWFTLIWGSISIVIGLTGGYFIYKRQKRIEEQMQNKDKKEK